MYIAIQKPGIDFFLHIFESRLLCSPSIYLIKKYSKSSNILKYYYHLK